MAQYWDIEDKFTQPSKSELRSKASASVRKERKKGRILAPVVVSGRTIARNWWGKAWCENLERYADYENRLERGKRYVRSGTIVDLQIEKGRVLARVQGTRKTPYKTEVRISPLAEEKCQHIIASCSRKLENVEQLIQGKFPPEMEILFEGKDGLFPTPIEISFSCSCPDWALMCKHVAAVLYGVGARFDEDPLLFFKLRGIDFNRFIDVTLANKVELMLKNADHPKSDRIMDSGRLTELFGVL